MVEDSSRNSTYMSGEIQNEILEILAEQIVQQILAELGDRCYTVLFDETTDISKKEQMSIVIRYIDRNFSVC